MSQTSLPSHTGPIDRRTAARSSRVFAMNRWRIPAPRSKPSRTTYPVRVAAIRQNQSVSMSVGTLADPADHEEEEEGAQRRVKAHEAEQREHRVAGGDVGRRAVAGEQKSVDEPGLAAELRGHPARRVGDVREGEQEHQHPEQRAGVEQLAPPEQEDGEA